MSIEVTGLGTLQADLRRLLQHLDRPADLMRDLAAVLEGQVEQRLDFKRDPSGQRWAKLAESTVERYAAEDKGSRRGTLLERTGQMRNSLSASSGDDWAEVGMSRLSPNGAWQLPQLHEFGTTKMPRRGMFFADPEAGTLGQDDQNALADAIDTWLAQQFPG